jgi:Tol biopolymer transport system component
LRILRSMKIKNTHYLWLFIAVCIALILAIKFGSERFTSRISSKADMEEYLRLAQGYLEKGEPESAIHPLLLAIEKDDKNFRAHYLLGKVYHASKINHLAEKECLKSLQLETENQEAIELLCRIRFEKGESRWNSQDIPQAISEFLSILEKTKDRELIDSIAHLTGGNLKMIRLTNDLFCDDAPHFSPDGEKIVYHSDTNYFLEDYGLKKIQVRKSRIFLMDADGKNKKLLSPDGEEETSERFARFSHDGRFMVFEKENTPPHTSDTIFNTDRDIFIRDLNSGEVKRLTEDDIYDGLPGFSPDDKHIIFVSDRPGAGSRIHTIDLENGEIGSLSLKESWDEKIGLLRNARGPVLPYCPSFSPDGKNIMVHGGWDTRSIFLMDVEGEKCQRLTDGKKDCIFPSFSPDGKRIVFVSGYEDEQDLYLIDTDGSNLTRLTFDGGSKRYPSFSPDGGTILFAGKREGEPDNYFEIYLLQLNLSVPRELLKQRLEELKTATTAKINTD